MVKIVRRKGRKLRKRRGMLTLEWILLITILVIGVVAGLSVVRNSLIGEFVDLTQAITGVDVGE